MQSSHSPRLLPTVETSRNIRTQEDHKRLSCTEPPFRAQASLPPLSPRLCAETAAMTATNRSLSDNHHLQQAPILLDLESIEWPAQGGFPYNTQAQGPSAFYAPTFFPPGSTCTEYPQRAGNELAYNTNYNLAYPSHCSSQDFPRLYHSVEFSTLTSDMTTSYPPSNFFHSPPRSHDALSLPDSETPELMQPRDDYNIHYGSHMKHESRLNYKSPYSHMSRASTPYFTSHEDDTPIDKEQPYAQLIYRALLDAPNHTMVLRDIYDWFLRYTDKAAQSETKGWQNSIRHNLSMNGAFEKVDSPSDSSSKGFMWRLTPNALREGVKSTTRYRSKAPNKRSSTRTQPLPQRQASGAKGGHAARRAANLRRSMRKRESVYNNRPRSDPYAGAWDGETTYTTDSPFPTTGTPYTQYTEPNPYLPSDDSFNPILSMANQIVSPLRSYASTPLSTPVSPRTPLSHVGGVRNGLVGSDAAYVLDRSPGELLFTPSPTPSGDEPCTPTERCGVWEADVGIGEDVYKDLYCGGAA